MCTDGSETCIVLMTLSAGGFRVEHTHVESGGFWGTRVVSAEPHHLAHEISPLDL